MVFDEKDKALHKGLMKILDEGTFQLKAREVSAFAAIYNWAKSLEQRAQVPVEKQKDKKK